MNLTLQSIRCRTREFDLRVNAALTANIVGLFGASGAGKTTLIELIAGLRKPEQGTITFGGRVLFDSGAGIMVRPQDRKIGYVPQDLCLFPHLTVAQNIGFAQQVQARQSAATASSNGGVTPPNYSEDPGRRIPSKLAHILEIEPLWSRLPHEISGGEKQRVALARALAANPDLLLLDEPLASLDQPLRQKLLPYLKRVEEEFRTPIIYVSHDADEVAELCQQVLLMESGQIVASGSPAEIFVKRPMERHTIRHFPQEPIP